MARKKQVPTDPPFLSNRIPPAQLHALKEGRATPEKVQIAGKIADEAREKIGWAKHCQGMAGTVDSSPIYYESPEWYADRQKSASATSMNATRLKAELLSSITQSRRAQQPRPSALGKIVAALLPTSIGNLMRQLQRMSDDGVHPVIQEVTDDAVSWMDDNGKEHKTTRRQLEGIASRLRRKRVPQSG